MENNSDSDEPVKKKRPHLNSSLSNAMARSSNPSPPEDNHSVDAAVLQYQNQMMHQQKEKQKHELQDVEAKIKEMKAKQVSYDGMLIAVNQLWNQLVDDLALLGMCAGAGQNALQMLDSADYARGSIPSCPAEEMFLCRVLQRDSIETNNSDEVVNHVEEALTLRHTSTKELMRLLEHTIAMEREKTENIARTLNGKISSEDAIIELSKIDNMIEKEANNLRQVIDILHLKHKEYADVIQSHNSGDSTDQSEIRRITGDVDDSMAELEESRRKLVNLKMQKDVASGMHNHTSNVVNGNLSPEKSTERTISLQELKTSIEETKILAASRLSEFQESQNENLALSKQLQDFQNEVKDDKYVHSSRLYTMVNDQLQHWLTELERYKALTDSLQADRAVVARREKELNLKVESAEAVRNVNDNVDSRIEELEHQLQKCLIEKNELEINMEEAVQDSGRKDIISEFRVMSASLSKEMGMMETQLKQWKETAHETLSLRERSQSLKASLSTKTNERDSLANKCDEQLIEIKSLRALCDLHGIKPKLTVSVEAIFENFLKIDKLQKEKLELQIFLDLYAQESYGNRDMMEIKESERRAHSQAEMFRNALDDHSLELRVKAANEAEAACQQRLAATETEITEARAKIDASERDVLELTEAIKIKDKEAEAYISEIETIGQAYEDMQTQNQHLLQLVTERDDYNIKLVSESVKTKQTQNFLLSEKQALAKQLQQVNTSMESVKMRISQGEEQMKAVLVEALKSTEEDRHLSVNLEAGKWELTDAEKELQWLKYATTSSEKENTRIKQDIEDIQLDLDNERSLRKNVEEELSEWNDRIAKICSETGEAAIQKLQSEIKFFKNVLQCSVCTDRPKEVVIVKCFHLFCNYCVQKNLEIRHRKCPACGTPFGQSDIRFVKI